MLVHIVLPHKSIVSSYEVRNRKVLMEKLLTLKEVCDIFGITDPKGRFVRDLRTKGLLQGAKIGKKLYFKESDVIEFIDEQFDKQNKRRLTKGA